MDIDEKIINLISILYELESSDKKKIEKLLINLPLELKEKVLLSLYKAFNEHDFNTNTLAIKSNLIINELEELEEKRELEKFKI